MTTNRHGSAKVEYPNALDIRIVREFDAPRELVFDVLTNPEHVREHFAPFEEVVTVCDIDLRVGGNYHIVMVTGEGVECSFRGTYMEIERPARVVSTWTFEGWPDAEAVETVELKESDDVTTMTHTLSFRDQASRDHMTKVDGFEASFDRLDTYVQSLCDGGD